LNKSVCSGFENLKCLWSFAIGKYSLDNYVSRLIKVNYYKVLKDNYMVELGDMTINSNSLLANVDILLTYQ
jgi:hypothetical protein